MAPLLGPDETAQMQDATRPPPPGAPPPLGALQWLRTFGDRNHTAAVILVANGTQW